MYMVTHTHTYTHTQRERERERERHTHTHTHTHTQNDAVSDGGDRREGRPREAPRFQFVKEGGPCSR